MHDQSHQPPGTEGAEGRAAPPPVPRELGGHILHPQVIAGQVPSCSQTSGGGRSRKKEIPLQSTSELLVTWPAPSGTRLGARGVWWHHPRVVGAAGWGGRHPLQRQSLDKANKNELKNGGRPQTRRFAPRNWPVALGAGGQCWPLGAAWMSWGTGTLS